MICPDCMIQMYQKDRLGGGITGTEEYTTWEVKECDKCKRCVKEYYSATLLSEEDLKEIIKEQEQ